MSYKTCKEYSPYVIIESYGKAGEAVHHVLFRVDHQSFTVGIFEDKDEEDNALDIAEWTAYMLTKAINSLIEKEKKNGK